MPRRVEIPADAEVTPQLVQSLGSTAGAQASPARQQETQAAAAQPAEGAAPSFLSALGSQIAARTTEPLAALTSPQSTMLERAGGALSLGTTIAAPYATAIGALIQAGAEAGGVVTPGGLWSNVLGGVAEIGSGGVSKLFKSVVRPKATVNRITKAFAKEGDMAAWPSERVGSAIRAESQRVMKTIANPLKKQLNTLESKAAKHTVQPNSTAYGHMRAALDTISDFDLPIAGEAKRIVTKLEEAVANGQAVSARDFVQLRKFLKRPKVAAHGDPDVAQASKLLGGVRDRFTQGVEAAMRDAGDDAAATAYNSTLRSWGINVAEPRRAIRAVLSPKRTPQQAFKSAFSLEDPNAFRTLTQLAKKSPAIQTKLRLGYFETLRAATNDFTKGADTLTKFRDTRPALEAAGLFTAREMDDIHVLMRRGDALEKAGSNIAAAIGRLGQGAATSAMLGGATYAYTQDPKYLAIAAMASGAAPFVKQLVMLPGGSRESQRLAALIARQVAKGADAIFSEETQEPGEVEEPEP